MALTRYVDFFKAWTWDEQAGEAAFRDATTEHAVALENAATTGDEVGPPPTLVVRPSVDADVGIPLPPVAGTGVDPTQKTWDNQVRVPLRISGLSRVLSGDVADDQRRLAVTIIAITTLRAFLIPTPRPPLFIPSAFFEVQSRTGI